MLTSSINNLLSKDSYHTIAIRERWEKVENFTFPIDVTNLQKFMMVSNWVEINYSDLSSVMAGTFTFKKNTNYFFNYTDSNLNAVQVDQIMADNYIDQHLVGINYATTLAYLRINSCFYHLSKVASYARDAKIRFCALALLYYTEMELLCPPPNFTKLFNRIQRYFFKFLREQYIYPKDFPAIATALMNLKFPTKNQYNLVMEIFISSKKFNRLQRSFTISTLESLRAKFIDLTNPVILELYFPSPELKKIPNLLKKIDAKNAAVKTLNKQKSNQTPLHD
jgi:hypothetical protein